MAIATALTEQASVKSLRRDVQGLRGIAVTSVILYHFFPTLMPGGFIGVDVFFVISGFVISRSIFRDLDRNIFSFRKFYARRARRILPPLMLMTVCVVSASWFLLPPRELLNSAGAVIATVFLSSNLWFWRYSSYFDGPSGGMPMLHTWSLAVEEQFYLLFPLCVYVVYRYFRRGLAAVLMVFAALSLLLSVTLLTNHPSAAFYLGPCRAFEILMGAMIAVIVVRIRMKRWAREVMLFFAISMICASLAFYHSHMLFPGLAALLPCTGAAIAIWIGSCGTTSLGQLLSSEPIVLIGGRSYSLYLWQWPVLVLGRHYLGNDLSFLERFACLTIAALGAILSFELVERPLLMHKKRWRGWVPVCVGTMATVTAFSLTSIDRGGFPGRFSVSARSLFASSEDFNQLRERCHNGTNGWIPYIQNCRFGNLNAPSDVAVWGDSQGTELVVAVGEILGRKQRSAMEITASACPPATDYSPPGRPLCRGHNRETLEWIIQDGRIRTVVLAARFDSYEKYNFDEFCSGFTNVVASLLSNGKRVIIVYPIPIMDFDAPVVLGLRNAQGRGFDDVGIRENEFVRQNSAAISFLDRISSTYPVRQLIPENLLCVHGRCQAYRQDVGVLYFNWDHLSVTGARILAKALPL